MGAATTDLGVTLSANYCVIGWRYMNGAKIHQRPNLIHHLLTQLLPPDFPAGR
jgi:hypothetical protein